MLYVRWLLDGCMVGHYLFSFFASAMYTMVLYMSFDRFLLAVESRDLSQADKSIKIVSSFPKLSDG